MVWIGQIRCHEIISQTPDNFVCAWKAKLSCDLPVLEPDSSPSVFQSSVREKRKGEFKHFPSPLALPSVTTSHVPSPACDSRVQIKATVDESVLEPLDNDPIRLETRSRDTTASVGSVYSHFFDHHFIYQH